MVVGNNIKSSFHTQDADKTTFALRRRHLLWKILKAVTVVGREGVVVAAAAVTLIFFAAFGVVSDGGFQAELTHSRPGLVPSL